MARDAQCLGACLDQGVDNVHPDLSFGKTHVNVTIPAGGDAPGAAELGYASRVNQLDDVT